MNKGGSLCLWAIRHKGYEETPEMDVWIRILALLLCSPGILERFLGDPVPQYPHQQLWGSSGHPSLGITVKRGTDNGATEAALDHRCPHMAGR